MVIGIRPYFLVLKMLADNYAKVLSRHTTYDRAQREAGRLSIKNMMGSRRKRLPLPTAFLPGYGIAIVGENVWLDENRHIIRPNK